MSTAKTVTIHLDENAVRALEQLKRQIDSQLPDDVLPPFTIPALARHAIVKWCDSQAAAVRYRHDAQGNSEG